MYKSKNYFLILILLIVFSFSFNIVKAETALIPASSVYYKTNASYYSCNPVEWSAATDHSTYRYEYLAEMSFNLSSISSSETVFSARVCSYAYYLSGTPRNYIEKLSEINCAYADSATRVPSNIGFEYINASNAWNCIDIDIEEVDLGEYFYVRWWGQDINGAYSPYASFKGPASTDCSSNPSGASDCRSYIEIVYGIPTPEISVTPSSRSFGEVNIGSSDNETFIVENVGTGTLSGSVSGLASPFSCVSGCSYNLSAGQSQTTTIRFSPTSEGNFSDTAIFSGADGSNNSVSGVGVEEETGERIFYEIFPSADYSWQGSGDTSQSEDGWVTEQGSADWDDIQISNEDVSAGTPPPSGGNHLNFEDCDDGFYWTEIYDLAYVPVDLSAYEDVILKYYWQSDDVDSGEGLRVAYSIDSTDGMDGTWYLLDEHINPTDDRWHKETIDIPNSATVSNFMLRFSSLSNLTSEHIFVDDVELRGTFVGSCSGEGEVCVINDDCCSGHCAHDYDSGQFCCDVGECTHDGTCYTNSTCQGTYICNSGTWQDHCTNGVRDCDETDIDCGGADCGECGTPCEDHDIWGWAWTGDTGGDGIGWISLSCKNEGASTDYGIDIESDGNLTGYAYFDMNDSVTSIEEIGWIDFNPDLSGRPGGPNYTARIDIDGTTCGQVGRVCGWARALNTDSSWDGWLLFNENPSHSFTSYSVNLNSVPSISTITGYAWGSDVLGWVKIDAQTNFKLSTPNPPTASGFRMDGTPDYCTSIQRRGYVTLSWLYQSDGGYSQEQYELQISTNSGFSGATSIAGNQSVSPGGRGTTGLAIIPSPIFSDYEIGYNDTYYLRIKVKDTENTWSDWSNTLVVSTAAHAYPYPDFDWDPTSPAVEETVIMDNLSVCYNISNNPTSCSTYTWTIPVDATFVDSTNSSSFEPHIQFTSTGSGDVELVARDSNGYSCDIKSTIGIQLPFPDWIEINPED